MLLFARTIRLLRRPLRRNAESETWRHWNWVLDHKNLPHLLPAINVDTLHGWSKASKEVLSLGKCVAVLTRSDSIKERKKDNYDS